MARPHAADVKRLADACLPNSIPVEKNVLSGGSIGQIVRNVNPATYEHEDLFFHYDQVGSVMTVSDAGGHLALPGDTDDGSWFFYWSAPQIPLHFE